jgi:alkaline phosphatase
LVCFSFLSAGAVLVAGLPAKVDASPPKNVIVMISDGCGYNHLEAANYYQYGVSPAQPYESWPYARAMSTYSGAGDGYFPITAWSAFDYVMQRYTDSAAAATAMSSGVKTYDAAIGVDMDGNPLEHIADRMKDLDKATGVVSSVQFSHATPAGFVAHNVSRNNYSQIAQEMLCDSRCDVIMGCGNPWYNADGQHLAAPNDFRYVGGRQVWESLEAGLTDIVIDAYGNTNTVEDCNGDGVPDAWALIQTRQDFQALMSGDAPVRVCGVPTCFQTLEHDRSGDYHADPYVVPLNETVCRLDEMTRGAINVLDNDPDGFFLMIEGGAIDWASHGNASGRLIEEQIDFNNSVQAVIDWVETHSNWDETMVIVTGDHETGYLCGPGSNPGWMPIVNNGAGVLPGMEWHSTSHTNGLIPIFAKGQEAAGLVRYTDEYDSRRGLFINNTELGQYLFELYPTETVPEPKVVIVMISDGWGYNHITATDYYQNGAAGSQVYES